MATATGTTTTEQVAIDMENMNNSNNQMDSLTAGVVSVDGPHRSSGHRRHNRYICFNMFIERDKI